MHYQVSRNGQEYGPYTLEDLQRYVASGNVLPTDLTKSEEMAEWVPVSQVLAGSFAGGAGAPAAAGFSTPAYADQAAAPVASQGSVSASQYQDAPNLHWGLVLLFNVLTCGIFMMVWNLIIAAWLKRVQPNATALYWYIAAYAVLVLQGVTGGLRAFEQMAHPGTVAVRAQALGAGLYLIVFVLRLVARYSEQASLEEHFNGPEPIGLQLNGVMTFFFGGLYFQSRLNGINAMKQAARFSAGRGY